MNPSGLVFTCILLSVIGSVCLAKTKPFKYEVCNKKSTYITQITRFTISPDPVSLSKNITATVDIHLQQDIPPGAFIRTKVYKVTRLFVTLEIPAPCLAGIGSCTTEHCKFLNSFKDQACPFFQPGTECGCPIKAGYYGGDNITVPVPQLGSLLKFIASGEFKIVVELLTKENYKENILACYSFTGTAKP